MRKIESICYGIMVAVMAIVLVTGCASTGTKTSYVTVERESPKITRIFGGLLYIVGGAMDVLSGNPVGIVNGISDMTIRSYGEFESVNTQTIKVEEHKDGSITTKPVD